jgi:hypothetical protein
MEAELSEFEEHLFHIELRTKVLVVIICAPVHLLTDSMPIFKPMTQASQGFRGHPNK